MPAITTIIDSDQREGLYELIRNHLGSIEDFWLALERTKDFAKAEQLGLEFSEDFRLLKDIGWQPSEDREVFELTMAPHDLAELLRRLRGDARQLLVGSPSERRSRDEDEKVSGSFQLGLNACEELLAELGCERGTA